MKIEDLYRRGVDKYVDEEFPADLGSLVGNNSAERYQWKSFHW